MRKFFSYGLALIIVVVLGLWLATGTLVVPGHGPGNGEVAVLQALDKSGKASEALEGTGLVKPKEAHEEGPDPALTIAERQAATSGSSAAPRSVRIATYTMQPMKMDADLRGRTKAKEMVSVVPETSGTVQQVLVTKGQQVKEGDTLCRLDPSTRAAAVAQAQASLDTAKSAFDANATLRKKGLAPANSGLALESQLKAAQAAVANAEAELARVEVKATISGVIQDPLASVGSTLGPGAPCATIVQLDPMLFVASIPEARVKYARLDLPATVRTVTGDTVEGKVSYIASTADPATRSFAVEIEIPNPDGKVRDGITADATVNLGTTPAHLLPQSVLTLDDEGVIGVRVVEDSKVKFYPVTILRDTREGIWVAGLPPKTDVITVGQENVQAGQTVKAGYGPESEPAAAVAASEAAHG